MLQEPVKSKFLTQTMVFNTTTRTLRHSDEFDVFPLLKDGKINQINDYIQKLQAQGEADLIKQLVNKKDTEGKSLLTYAIYYNYRNLVLYLMSKGANPYETNNDKKSLFHLAAYHGRHACIQLLLNQERHQIRLDLLAMVKISMRDFQFKRTEVKNGQLICPEKSLVEFQQRFKDFQEQIYDLYDQYTVILVSKFRKAMTQLDIYNRNPVHYAALSKFPNCLQTAKLLLNCKLMVDGYDEYRQLFDELQNLELNKDKRIDTRQYLNVLQTMQNFLTQEQINKIEKSFHKKVKNIQIEIINTQDSEGFTPLHLCSFQGDYAFVQYLKKLGADTKTQDCRQKKDALDYSSNDQVRSQLVDLKDAARNGDEKSFSMLLNCGNKLDSQKSIFGIAPVHNAVSNAHQTRNMTLLHTIIKCNADLDIADSNGWTPLHLACQLGDLEIVKILLQNHASVFKFSNKKYYPIHVAAMHNRADIIDYMLNHFQDEKKLALLNARSQNQETPLHLASKKGAVESIKTLLKHGADVYAVDLWKRTSLHYAAFNFQKQAVNLLCKHDVDYDKLRNMRNTQGKLARELVKNSDLNFAQNTIWNAAQEGKLDIVRKLTILGENVNQQTRVKKRTPLHLAAMNLHLLVVRFLLDNQASPEIKDIEGKTPIDYARETKNEQIIQLFNQDQKK